MKFLGTGEKTDALELFYPDRLASRILGMGDVPTLVDKAEKAFDMQSAKQMEKKMHTSQFDLEDLLWQLQQVDKMGTLAQMVEMLPGFSKLSSSDLEGREEKQVGEMEAIILSMTREEQRNPATINGGQRRRIAQGSGTTPRDANTLLNQYYQIRKLARMAA